MTLEYSICHQSATQLQQLQQTPFRRGFRISMPASHLGSEQLVIRATSGSSSASLPWPSASSSSLPIREIPGSYGPPLLGSVYDRFNYFVLQGRDEFFQTLVKRYGSTVIRVNMPPGPPFFPDSRTIMLLDQKSIRILFDTCKVEKKNVFVGTYMPSADFTGGHRVLPYLDPSEEKHHILKGFCFEILKINNKKWLSEFHAAFVEAAEEWETQIRDMGSADFTGGCQHFTLNFLLRSVLDRDPAEPGEASLGRDGPSCIQAWLALQLAPQTSLGFPGLIEEVTLHTFPFPFVLVSQQYDRIYRFFWVYGKSILDMAGEKFRIDRDEACHNLVFYICFNTWGGLQLFFPSIVRQIAEGGLSLQRELAVDVRVAVQEEGGYLNMRSLAKMELVHSTVYEILRMDPPVPFQYGKAKEDLVVESHDAAFRVKKGELLGGYQGIAMRDPKVFSFPNAFQPKRFMGVQGRELLNSLTWSNGPETENPTLANKQCAGKDFVNLIARLFVAELFLRYDFFRLGHVGKNGARASFSFTTLKKRRVHDSS